MARISQSKILAFATLGVITAMGNACSPNYNRSLVEHSVSIYIDSLDVYHTYQDEYFDLLESLEIASDDVFLGESRRDLKKELEIRRLELHNMQILINEEIQQWEKQVFENRQELKVIEKATDEANKRIIKQRLKKAVTFN